MTAETPSAPDDETRAHATEPAEGSDETPGATAADDGRQHASEPAEGEDLPGS